ncbi:MAG: hypothetical protein U0R64_06440 [Candidatus Nanopelagicales bacterium]
MLATPGSQPVGPDWVYEVKMDGIRLICRSDGIGNHLTSRNGRDLTAAFPELTAAPLPADTVVDGELVAAGTAQPPTLQDIAPRIHRRNPDAALVAACPVTYVLFDVLRLRGRDVSGLPLSERRRLLADIVPDDSPWVLADQFDDGAALWTATKAAGFEGVIAKRRSSRYRPGTRSPDWIKTPHRTVTDAAVMGWRPESGARRRVGALALALPHHGAWRYVGSVGSGMTQPVSDALLEVLPQLARPDPPTEAPDADPGTRWVDPVLIVSVRHLGTTTDGRLRHPVLVAVRPDLTAEELLDGGPNHGEEQP